MIDKFINDYQNYKKIKGGNELINNKIIALECVFILFFHLKSVQII